MAVKNCVYILHLQDLTIEVATQGKGRDGCVRRERMVCEEGEGWCVRRERGRLGCEEGEMVCGSRGMV